MTKPTKATSGIWGWSDRQNVLKRGECPDCAGKLEELIPIPSRGNGYSSIRGCKTCRRVYYVDMEDK